MVSIVTAMDTNDALERSRIEFEQRLFLVKADDWTRSTPCDEWDVRALVNHVIGGCRRYTALLHGASADDFRNLPPTEYIGEEATRAFGVSADEMIAAFNEPGSLDRIVHHPMGDRPGQVLAVMRVTDFVVHGWDLARAIGADETIDVQLAEWVWPPLDAMSLALSQSGYFHHSETVLADDASRQDRLLHLLGRV
ncbi:MAG: TIGR03086 family metal-binding protein [Acidimicrobiales bacterium]